MKPFLFASRHPRLGVLCTLILATQLAACGGDDGGSNTTPPPSGGGNTTTPPPPGGDTSTPPPVTKIKLTLTGTVTDEPIANANVTATIGSETFTATADASGNYSVDVEIEEANKGKFITLNATGVGAQSFVEFTSLAGSFEALAARAGTDKTLSRDESFATQITNVSTAAAVLLKDANAGEPVVSDALLASLGASINAQDVLDLAAAIKLAVDDAANYPLPAGQTSILALASDATARQQFINSVYEADPAAFAAAQTAIAQDPGLSKAVDVEDLEGGFTTALLSSQADFSFNYTGRVMHFDLNEGGTGYVSSDTFDQAMTWAVEGTTIRVTYASPVETVSYDTENCNGTVRQVKAHYVSEGVTVSFLNEKTVAIKTVSDVTYADCDALDPREDVSTVARTVLSLEDNFQVIDAEELHGEAQTVYVYDSAQQRVVADIADIAADGTGTTQLTNLSFTWELDESGKILRAEFNDGSVGEYLVLREIDDVASDIFWEVRSPGDGPVYMGAGASVFADPEYDIDVTAEAVPGRFYQFGIGEEGVNDTRLKGFRLRFDANFMGAQEYDFIDDNDQVVTMDETDESYNGFRWSLDDGDIVVRRTFDAVAQVDTCLFGEANCVLYDERRIVPLAMVGSRVYWVEVRRTNFNGITANTPATRLVRFYDYEPFAGTAVGSSKGRIAAKASKPRELLRGPALR